MQRTAVFIDAGYLFAQGSVELLGKKMARSALHLDAHAARDFFRDLASQLAPRSELLRIYWYDGTPSGPTPQHLALAHLDDVKVRLGFVNSVGEQKGVDSLIVTDMIELARNRAIADAILLSGDEDLRVGVQQAQEFGVRVHCVGIRPARGSQSLFLLMEADSTSELDGRVLSGFLRAAETRGPTLDAADPGDPELSIEDVCARVVVPLAERQGGAGTHGIACNLSCGKEDSRRTGSDAIDPGSQGPGWAGPRRAAEENTQAAFYRSLASSGRSGWCGRHRP